MFIHSAILIFAIETKLNLFSTERFPEGFLLFFLLKNLLSIYLEGTWEANNYIFNGVVNLVWIIFILTVGKRANNIYN